MICSEHNLRASMTDEEFWEHVFHPDGKPFDDEPDDDDIPAIWAIDCARCGDLVEVDEETAADRERDAFCDDCANEMIPETEEIL